MIKHRFVSFLFLLVFTVLSCKTIKQPDYVAQPLDYTQDDVIANEKKNILRLQQTNSVFALYRAVFLNDQETIESCVSLIKDQIINSVNDKDYFEATRYLKSLEAVGRKDLTDYSAKVKALLNSDLPGTNILESKKPKNIQDCINATVTIWVDQGLKVSNGTGYQDIVIGSGFFIDNRGYIITNHHVIQSLVDPRYEGYSRLYIKLHSDPDTKIPATVIGYDSTLDLALLKTEIQPPFILSLGSSSDLNVGDKVNVIGSPIGLEGTLTSGIISSVDRKLTTLGNVFQLDAAVNSGNSGGPLIDQNRKVQAIVFAGMLQYQGLNFAIPVEYLKQELPLLFNGGQVFHCWTGTFGHTKRVKGEKKGLEIEYTMPGGSSNFAKLKYGDLITQIDGNKITCLEDFQLVMLNYLPGTIVKCKYQDGDDKTIKETVLYLDKRPENPSVSFFESDLMSDSFIPLFGMQMTPSSTTNRKSYTITRVVKGSIADEMGFSPEDPVTVQDFQIDYKNKRILAQVYVKRRTKGFLDISMMLAIGLDSPNYF